MVARTGKGSLRTGPVPGVEQVLLSMLQEGVQNGSFTQGDRTELRVVRRGNKKGSDRR